MAGFFGLFGNKNANGTNDNVRRANDDSINPFLKMAREIKK